ncbi:MAG: hypothetical protein NZT61_03495 [Deltaproteobacteria bacterium]|nr:hypothetical protein [Deltaproteobacteria bacterium]
MYTRATHEVSSPLIPPVDKIHSENIDDIDNGLVEKLTKKTTIMWNVLLT